MELTEEFIKENELNENQAKAINTHYGQVVIPELKKTWDGKANENAESILSGAATYATKTLGVELEREKGEKLGDFLKRLSGTAFEAQRSEYEAKKNEYEAKLKDFKGSPEMKKQLEELQSKNDELLQQVATIDELKEKAGKYDELSVEYNSQKKTIAYGQVKPNFPETVNKYEADAKWNAFVANFEKEYDLQIVDGEAVGVSKENKHKTVQLKDLVSKDEELQALLSDEDGGEGGKGTGAKPASKVKIEGVPFEVPENADSKERTKLIREHLASKGMGTTHKDYSKEFAKLNKAILEGKKEAAKK